MQKTEAELADKFEMDQVEFDRLVQATYSEFMSGEALTRAQDAKDERRTQVMLRLRDFATVVEAERAMSAGDIGRLMEVWKRWSIMVQGIKGLTHYSNYLPRLVRLLTTVLPPELSKVIRHSLLITPSGRKTHFVAKDFYLEVQNYWLKYFYNHSVSVLLSG